MTFLSFTDENRTYHSIDIWSDSTGDEIGGVTINSLDVGNIATLDHLSGITLCFDSNDDSTSELGESVFWENANDTLEIESLSITFGKLEYGAMHVSLEANCFTYAPHKDITVTVIALARIVP